MIAPDLQEQILDKLNTLIVVLNNDGSIDYVSRSANPLLGYEPSHLIGQAWWEKTRFTRPEGMEVKSKIIKMFRERPDAVSSFEHLLRTREGGQKWFSWTISRLNEDQLIGLGHDITLKKQAEKRLLESNRRLTQQNKDITDSIHYAERIQRSILQSPEQLRTMFRDSFVLFRPKDIVSGDYYFFHQAEELSFVAAVDCTGHGVPGAMMSMVASSLLKEVLINRGLTDPAAILGELDKELGKTINAGSGAEDGMDVALICYDKKNSLLYFGGAFRPLLICRNEEFTELRGDRYPIGFYAGIEKKFVTQCVEVKEGDCVYLFSDGYTDQFGGGQAKKLNRSNFKELLRTASGMTMEEQEAFLEYAFNNWKQEEDQTDDVLVIGLRI